jgi:cell division protein FtsQ
VAFTKILFRVLSVLIIIPVLLGGALFWMNEKGAFNLDHIEVLIDDAQLESHYLKPQVEVVEKMIEASRGQSLWRIDLSEMQKKIQALDWIENVNLVRQWPTTLRAKIKPLDIKMLLLTKKGVFLPIVKSGNILNPIEMKNAPDAMVLRGDIFQKNPELRKKAVDVLENIPSEGSFSRAQISEISYKEKEGFWVTLVRSGIEVRLGQDQVPLKSARVSQVLDYLQSHQFEARVIDADLSQKVLVRLRKDP